MNDVTVLTQDPAFGGGLRSQLDAWLAGARAIGLRPRLEFVSLSVGVSTRRRPGLRPHPARPPYEGVEYPALLPELDALNLTLNAGRIARRLSDDTATWVIATSAPYGAAASVAGRPYACWIGTGLEHEWESRRGALSASRRLALALNRRPLLRLERRVLRDATAVWATSPTSRRTVAEAGGLDLAEVGILRIPVDPGRFAPAPDDEWLRGLERPTLVFVGRALDARKNVGLLLDAFRLLRRRVPEARLRLVGEAPAAALPEGAVATGPVADVAAELRAATCLVLPSLQEGFGIVVAEALAAGVPAVVTPSGGPEELVRASGGGVVLGSFAAEELAAALEALLADGRRLAAARAAGRAYVLEHHSPAGFARELAAAHARIAPG